MARSVHPLLRPAAVRLYIAAALLTLWLVLVWVRVSGAEELIQFCKVTLAALAVHHVHVTATGQP